MNFTDIAVICYILCFLITAAMIFFERRDPVVSMAWAFSLCFFAFCGFAAVFGFRARTESAHKKNLYSKAGIEQ